MEGNKVRMSRIVNIFLLVLISVTTLTTFLIAIPPLVHDAEYNNDESRKTNFEFYQRLHLYVIPSTTKDYETFNSFFHNESIWMEINGSIFHQKSAIIKAETRDLVGQIYAVIIFGIISIFHLTYGIILFSPSIKTKWKLKFLSNINVVLHIIAFVIWFSATASYFGSLVFLVDRNYYEVTKMAASAMKRTSRKIVFKNSIRHFCKYRFHGEEEGTYQTSINDTTREKLEDIAASTKICQWEGLKIISLCLAAVVTGFHGCFSYVLAAYVSCCRHIELDPPTFRVYERFGIEIPLPDEPKKVKSHPSSPSLSHSVKTLHEDPSQVEHAIEPSFPIAQTPKPNSNPPQKAQVPILPEPAPTPKKPPHHKKTVTIIHKPRQHSLTDPNPAPTQKSHGQALLHGPKPVLSPQKPQPHSSTGPKVTSGHKPAGQ